MYVGLQQIYAAIYNQNAYSSGIKQLRLAIVEFHKRVDSIFNISPDDVIIGPGTKQLSFLLEEVFNGGMMSLFISYHISYIQRYGPRLLE